MNSVTTFKVADDNLDIVLVDLSDFVTVNLDLAKKVVADRLQFANNKPHYLVVNVTRVRSITKQAREFLQQPEGGLKNILGAALIASNPVSSLIANIFIKTPKSFQAKFFWNEKEALNWIYQCRHEINHANALSKI